MSIDLYQTMEESASKGQRQYFRELTPTQAYIEYWTSYCRPYLTNDQINTLIKEAVKTEDYEEAQRLKDLLDKSHSN